MSIRLKRARSFLNSPRHSWIPNATLAIVLVGASSAALGCAGATKNREEFEAKQAKHFDELQTQISTLSQRIESMEGRLTGLNDKVDSARISLDSLVSTQRLKGQPSPEHPADDSGVSVPVQRASGDPEADFVNDLAIQSYRKAMIFFDAEKFSESVLEFSSFLEQYADHALAGSAQFYIGHSYMKQKEYKLALQEFNRVLTSYDRSAHVADTLRQMAAAEDLLKMREDAAKHRQLLLSLFPNSPAAENGELAKMNSQEIVPAKKSESPTDNSAPAAPDLDPPPTAPIPATESAPPG